MPNPIIEELKTLRDEIKLQAHLFSMDSKERYTELEKKLEALIQKFGEFNEEFWATDKAQVTELIKEYKNLKDSFTQTSK